MIDVGTGNVVLLGGCMIVEYLLFFKRIILPDQWAANEA